MATGRTHFKHTRTYVGGYDLSGYTRAIGTMGWEYQEADMTCPQSDAAKGYLPDVVTISLGDYAGVFDNTATSGLHTVLGTPGSARVVSVPIGIRTAPAAGDPVFVYRPEQLSYTIAEAGRAAVVNIGWGGWDGANIITPEKPWGTLLHANSAATAANSSTGVDDRGASSSKGGYMVYHVFAGDGTATITVEEADTNEDGSFAALTNATTGEIDFSSVTSGVVSCGVTATVKRYLRWQISLNTATTVTFALTFVRG